MRKIVETRSPLSNTIKDTSTIMRNPSLHNSDKGVTLDCASILDSIAKGTSCFHYFSHGTSLHRHSFSRMIFTLVKYYCLYSPIPLYIYMEESVSIDYTPQPCKYVRKWAYSKLHVQLLSGLGRTI